MKFPNVSLDALSPSQVRWGFLEKVYENALAHELTKAGLMVRQQIAIEVEYDGGIVGTHIADLSCK